MRKAIPLGVVDYETLKNQNYFFEYPQTTG